MDRERLATVLGMMGSAHDGEALNAARLAVRMLKEAKATWPEVLDGEQVAVEAARGLLAENEQLQLQNRELQEELARLRRPPLPTSWAYLVSRSRRRLNGLRSLPTGSARLSLT
jgi:hypothetical protein